MRGQRNFLIGCFALVAMGTSAVASASDYWFHVRVEEDGGAKVSVNLPAALFERALPLVPEVTLRRAQIDFDHSGLRITDLRAIWNDLRDSPDMTLVKVEDHGENARVWKKDGFFFVDVDERHGDSVQVRLPVTVVDALLASETLDVGAAIEALIAAGGGEFVTINEDRDGDRVRVWVDRTPEAD
jgi:hypothetical protein